MVRPSREELEAENARLADRVADLERALAERDDRLKTLEELVERLHRRGKRQSAPFSKGNPVRSPKKPGRKSGSEYGAHGHRAAPGHIDRELEAPLPGCCPDCGGGIVFDRWDEQFQTELPDPRPVVTRFKIGIGHCADCRKRVQGCHPEQTTDALGAAASHLGPNARALGLWFHYVLGLSFLKAATLLGRLGVPVTRRRLVLRRSVDRRVAHPDDHSDPQGRRLLVVGDDG